MTASGGAATYGTDASDADSEPGSQTSTGRGESVRPSRRFALRPLAFAASTLAWCVVVLAYLSAIDSLTAQSAFVGAFVGFLVLVEITTVDAGPAWNRAIRAVLLAGYLTAGYVLHDDVLRVLGL